jgi:hypothetical protein
MIPSRDDQADEHEPDEQAEGAAEVQPPAAHQPHDRSETEDDREDAAPREQHESHDRRDEAEVRDQRSDESEYPGHDSERTDLLARAHGDLPSRCGTAVRVHAAHAGVKLVESRCVTSLVQPRCRCYGSGP